MNRTRKTPSLTEVYSRLKKEFGEVETPLHYKQPHELAIAVILSAQCTDERVNQISPELFRTFPTLASFANAELSQIEKKVFSTGFYKNKAKNIQGFAKMVLNEFGGIIPNKMEDAIKLPGFGRKTANVVLAELYGVVEGFVVDTHVKRITKRLGFTKNTDPIKIEKDMLKITPTAFCRNLSLYLIFLGRKQCAARRTDCPSCPLSDLCPSYSE
ncbi:endonuclease III [Leptospira sp. 96542]|nr:endonuclease III [Leptospira sp. 96542]